MPRGRILCLTSNFPRWPGDSTTPFVLHLVQDLQQFGWQIVVLAPHAPGAKCHEMLEGVQVRRFRYLWPEGLETVCYQGGVLINLRKNPVNYLKLPALVLCEWCNTLLWLRREKFDLLHSHWLLPQGLVGILTAKPLGIPHVCTVHGGDIFGLQGRFYKILKSLVVRLAEAVTVNSSVTRQAVEALSPRIKELRTIPMGVAAYDSSRYSKQAGGIRAQFHRGQGPLLIFVGRLVEEKGLADLMEAMALLRARHRDITLLVIGEGQDRALLEQLADRLGLVGHVRFTGWISTELIPMYLAAADIFVAPSRKAMNGWVEAQGLTIIEAMMAGLPIIATRTGGVIDSIDHEVSGLLISERSPAELAAAIERLVKEPELARRLGEKARTAAMDKFSRQATAEKFSQLFESLCHSQNQLSANG